MEETYIFEDALNLMREGALMKNSYEYFTIYSVIGGILMWKISDGWNEVKSLSSEDIMGSWV